jgi:hypothetical protein
MQEELEEIVSVLKNFKGTTCWENPGKHKTSIYVSGVSKKKPNILNRGPTSPNRWLATA